MAERRRVVVKIGTNTVSDASGVPDPRFLADMAGQVAALRREGHEVLVVSSGAIGAGRAMLGFKEKVRDVKLRQACAAVGQARLMQAWEQAFAPQGLAVAQLLLTYHSFASRRSFLNLRRATEALLDLGVVPIINENDTVSIDEIDASFGDNDRLSALVAAKAQADLLVLLSDVAGLYTRPPGEPGAALVPVVERITPEVLRMAGARTSSLGRGGMRSKLEAIAQATRAGVPVVLTRGREPDVLRRILAGEALGTRFLPQARPQAKKAWLRHARPQGRVHVDAGAARALRAGKHLLPAGVTAVEGAFAAGAVVDIVHQGEAVARALAGLGAEELAQVRGLRSAEAARALGRAGPFNVTRKGNVAVLDGSA